MRCPSCKFENRTGVRFCENCGNQFTAPPIPSIAQPSGVYCPNCGQANPANASFCMNCGHAFRAAPVSVAYPRRRIQGCLIWVSLLTVLFLMCGLSYWTTLIRVPILPRTSSAPAVIIEAARVANTAQHNLNPPQPIIDFADHLYGAREPKPDDTVVVFSGQNPNRGNHAGGTNDNGGTVPPPGFSLPSTCGPEVELTVTNVTTVQPFGGGFAGLWGSGPSLYEIQNSGESMAEADYGYYAQWIIHKGGETQTIEKDKWYSCSGWENNLLTCAGPDRSSYDSAELTIFSENPACPVPLAGFSFEGESPLPVEKKKSENCSPIGAFRLAGFVPYTDGVVRDDILWEFDIHIENYTLEQIDYQYYLVAEGFDSTTGEWKTSQDSCYVNIYGKLACWGWNQQKFPSINYALYQLPEELCTEPVELGSMGSITVAAAPAPQSCIPDIVRQLNNYQMLKMRGRDPWSPSFENIFSIHLNIIEGLNLDELEFYVTYDVFDSQGNPVILNAKYNCLKRDLFAIPCEGPWVMDNQSVTMRLYYANDGCNELLSERTWPGQPAFMLAPNPTTLTYNRCDAFKSIDIKPQILNWVLGSPVNLYFEIPGGVPGLERTIEGDNEPWEYSIRVAEFSSTDCQYYPDYKERLYCSISLPNSYSNTVNPLTLNVNECDQPLSTLTTYLVMDKPKEEEEEKQSCGPSPVWNAPSCPAWCSCMGGTLDLSCGGSECSIPAGTPCSSFCK